MNTRQIGRSFEIECIPILEKEFDKVIWLSKDSPNSNFDFECHKENNILFGDAKYVSNGGNVRFVSNKQKNADFIITNKNKQKVIIYKKDFDKLIKFYSVDGIKISDRTKEKLDKLKIHKNESYNEVIKRLIIREVTGEEQ